MTDAPAYSPGVLFPLKELMPTRLAKNKQERLLQLSSMHCRLLQHEMNELRWMRTHRKDYDLAGDVEYIETAVNEQRQKVRTGPHDRRQAMGPRRRRIRTG